MGTISMAETMSALSSRVIVLSGVINSSLSSALSCTEVSTLARVLSWIVGTILESGMVSQSMQLVVQKLAPQFSS